MTLTVGELRKKVDKLPDDATVHFFYDNEEACAVVEGVEVEAVTGLPGTLILHGPVNLKEEDDDGQ